MMWPVEKMPIEQLVDMFALRRGFEPLRADCEVSRTDGVDMRQLLEYEVRSRYASALITLPIEQLPTEDLSSKVRLVVQSDGSGVIDLPDNTVRVGEVKLSSWLSSVRAADATHPLVAAQANRWSRGGRYEPVVVLRGNRVYVYSPDRMGDGVESLTVVKMPVTGEPFAVTEPILNAINMNSEL